MMATDPRDPREAVAAELPHNVEAEAALLGALMIDNRLCDRVSDRLVSEHFFEALHGRIYDAVLREHQLGRKANPVTLKPYFTDDPAMRQLGGAAYLAQLTGSGAAVIGADDFAHQIVELARLRAMIGVGRAIAEKAGDTSTLLSFPEIVAYAESEIAEISRESSDGAEELAAADCADRAIRAGEDSQRRGVLCGCEPIDEALGQLRRQQLAIVGARPGMGKSALATDYAIGAARRGLELYEAGTIARPIGIILFSLEMSAEEIGARMLSSLTFTYDGHGVPYDLIESGQMNRQQIRRIVEARDLLERLPIQVIDIGQSTTARLGSLVRRWKRRFDARGIDLELVIVDYLQKLRPATRVKDRYEAITEVSQDLKTLAKVNKIAVMALAQLSRGVEQRGDHRPQLSDLRDSGQIEQDADIVLFLYRAQYYLEASEPGANDAGRATWEAAIEECRHRIEFICAKRRQGKTGKRIGEFHGAFAAMRARHD